jgi:hypothetical protein
VSAASPAHDGDRADVHGGLRQPGERSRHVRTRAVVPSALQNPIHEPGAPKVAPTVNRAVAYLAPSRIDNRRIAVNIRTDRDAVHMTAPNMANIHNAACAIVSYMRSVSNMLSSGVWCTGFFLRLNLEK